MRKLLKLALAPVAIVALAAGCLADEGNTGPPVDKQPCTTTYNGNLEVFDDNTVLDRYCVNGTIVIDEHADNVTVTNSVIEGGSWSGGFFIEPGATGLVVDNTEIDCNGVLGSTAIGGSNFAITDSEIRNCENGLHVIANVIAQRNLIHKPIPWNPIDDPHADGVQLQADSHDFTFEWNKIVYPDTSSSFTFYDAAGSTQTNIKVRYNGFLGGAYVVRFPVDGPDTGNQFLGNRIENLTSNEFGRCTSGGTDAAAIDVWGEESAVTSDWNGDGIEDDANIVHSTGAEILRTDC